MLSALKVSPLNFVAAWRWWVVVTICIVADQVTKITAENNLNENVPFVITGFFNFTLRYNTGAAFSFLANQPGWQVWFFGILASCVSVGLTFWVARINEEKKWLECWAFSLILSGAVGNLIDRLSYGHVIDFIEVHYKDVYYFPAFNIADSCICIGAGLLILDMLVNKKEPS